MEDSMAAKKHLLSYLIITFLVSYLYMGYIIYSGGTAQFGLAALIILMWIPGLVSIICRLSLRLGFIDIGLARGPGVYYLWAIGLPLVLALISALLCAAFAIRSFEPATELSRFFGPALLLLGAGLFGAFGEELGWRGFVLPKLVEAKVESPLFVSGLIWAAWHLPLVVFGGYYRVEAPALIAITYSLSIIGQAYFVGWLRLKAKSIGVATVAHASHNFFFQFFFPVLLFTREGSNNRFWEALGADAGLIPALLYLGVAFFGSRYWASKRNIGEPDLTPAFSK